MSTAIAKLATNIGVSEVEITDVVKGMIVSAKGQHGSVATDAELTVVSGICAQYDLNPLTREAHAFISGGKLSVVIGIDGWIKICNRQPNFNGIEYDYEFDGKELLSVTTKIHVKGRDYPVSITEWMDECYQSKSPAWQKFKKRMLRNKSTGQAVRVAFGISEVIDDDEAKRIDGNTVSERDITPQPTVDFNVIDIAMAQCGDLDTLKSECGDIREKMQTDGTWDTNKHKIIALNSKHKDRINSYSDAEEVESPVTDEEKTALNEPLEGELVEDDDIGFGDDSDEFGE